MTVQRPAAALLPVALLALPLLLSACSTLGIGGSDPAVAQSSATTEPVATVAELVVCDASVDCGDDPTRTEWDSIQACIQLATARSKSVRVTLVVTRDETPPRSAFSASVIARTPALPVSEAFSCHEVRGAGQKLQAGDYWLWVLYGVTTLDHIPFSLGQPEQ